MRILVAPNAFKGSLTARAVADLVVAGLTQQLPGSECISVPIADGGDGTVELLLSRGFDVLLVETVDALLRPNRTRVARQGATVVIELAEICGLASVQDEQLRPWDASCLGVGLAARAALKQGAKHIMIALGGSASVDGGLGLLAGLGYALIDANGREVSPTARGLEIVRSIGPSVDQDLIDACTWTLLVDVDSPACGPAGAAHVFGPQKGFTADECDQVDDAMRGWCSLVAGYSERLTAAELVQLPGAGAAGGFAVAASGVIGATIESGAQMVAHLTNLAEVIDGVDAVIVGEGRLDEQTLSGKGPAFVASLARAASKPVFAFAGSSTLNADQCLTLGISDARDVVTLVEVAGSVAAALDEPARWVRSACEVLGDRLRASDL